MNAATRFTHGDIVRDARQRPWLIVALVLFSLSLAANAPVLRWLPRYGLPRGLVVLILATELSAMAAYIWYIDRQARAAGLACPNCERSFTQSGARRLALSLGRCMSCDAPLASDARRRTKMSMLKFRLRSREHSVKNTITLRGRSQRRVVL